MENNNTSNKKTYYISIAILAGMFFIFGFVSWVNSILIPYFRISCELTHFESYFVAFAFYIAYFVMAVPSGVLLKRVGFKRGIMYHLFVVNKDFNNTFVYKYMQLERFVRLKIYRSKFWCSGYYIWEYGRVSGFK